MQASFQLPVNGASIQPSLRFQARCAIVTNPSACWVYLPDALDFVPPFTGSKILPFMYGTNVPRAVIQAPNGGFNNPIGGPAIVVFDSSSLAAAGGTQLPPQVNQISVALPLNGLYPDPNFSWYAQSGLVNNPSGNWWFFGDAQEYVAPYTTNKLIICRAPTQTPAAVLSAPSGQASVATGEAGSVTWYSSTQPPVSGSVLTPQVSPTATPLLLARQNNGGTATLTLTSSAIPSGHWDILSVQTSLQKAASTDYTFQVVVSFNGTAFAQGFGNTAGQGDVNFTLAKPYSIDSTGVETLTVVFTGVPIPFATGLPGAGDVNGIASFYYSRRAV